jgi:hypothetical protein
VAKRNTTQVFLDRDAKRQVHIDSELMIRSVDLDEPEF